MAFDRSHMQLTEQEREDLRREMREAGQMAKEWLRKKREREQQEAKASETPATTGTQDEPEKH